MAGPELRQPEKHGLDGVDSSGAGGCARTSGRRAGRHARGATLT
jgi:hypothetical protein